ncbi:MAG TPA: hypothetical protein GXZ82_06540 [Firmicutes bacterium]|nr:hypothetical protein [Bacillota bacterium]
MTADAKPLDYSPVAAKNELLTNPGFEIQEPGAMAPGWQVFQGSFGKQLVFENHPVYEGDWSFAIHDTSSKDGFGLRSVLLPASPGQEYEASVNQAVTDLSTVYVDVVDGVIFVQDFELVEPGVFPPGHAAFGGGDGGQLDSTVSYTGSNSWVIQAVPGTGNGLRHVPVPVIPGKTYRATVYATWEGTYPCSLYLDFVDASNTRITVVSALCNLDDPYWNSVELELTAPEDAVYARVIMYYGASEQYRKTWFDDVRIIELP